MHHIYHTEGFILEAKNLNEANKYYHIFTRDLGLVVASAQGIRKISSKLRFVLQDFSYVKIDFVKGKDFWRITSASKTNKLDELLKKDGCLSLVFNLSKFLKRLLPGEDANGELFSDFIAGLLFMEKTEDQKLLNLVEVLIVLRILYFLGYVGDEFYVNNFILKPYVEIDFALLEENKLKIVKNINNALKETHL
jgi:DNA repair protein RecO